MWPSLWVAFFFIPPMMLRAVVGRQGLTSTTHTTEPAHPSSFHCQSPSSGRFELWASYPLDVEAHSPHSVAQATVSVLVSRRGLSLSEIWGKISLPCTEDGFEPMYEDCEDCLLPF